MSRRKLAWFAVALLGVAGLIGYAARIPALPEQRPIPSPNGYDDFVVAASMLLGERQAPVGKETPEQLAAYVATNRLALERLRFGLTRSSSAPVYSSANVQTQLDTLSGMKALARLVAGEAESARQAQDWDRLVIASTQGMDFGLRLAQRGVLIDQLMATSAEAMARVPLEKALAEIPAAPARKAVLALLKLEPTRESFQSVLLNEELYVRRNSPLTMRIAWHLFLRRRIQATFDRAKAKHVSNVIASRTLSLQLAARAYTLERGQAPTSPQALIPEYLTAVPTHPVSGEPLSQLTPLAPIAGTKAPPE